MKVLTLRAQAPYDAASADPSAPGVLFGPQTKALVRWLRHTLRTGVCLATLRLPVGIVAWICERSPGAGGCRPAPDSELILSLLSIGAVVGGLVVVVLSTAVEAAATPAGRTPAHLAAEVRMCLRDSEEGHLARPRQARGSRGNAHLVVLTRTQLTAAQCRPIAMPGAPASRPTSTAQWPSRSPE